LEAKEPMLKFCYSVWHRVAIPDEKCCPSV